MYYQNVQYLLRKNGLGHIFISPQIYNAKQLVSIIKRNLTDQHRQMANTLISTDDKFNTLRLCTNIPEDIKPGILYKDYIKSPDIRRCFAFLRMDKAIKYNSTKQNQELKLCDVCLTTGLGPMYSCTLYSCTRVHILEYSDVLCTHVLLA